MSSEFLRPAVSNGVPTEQALIRRWWFQEEGARGRLVWEYHLFGRYADAIWFPDDDTQGREETGEFSAKRFPIDSERIVLLEAKSELSPELVGQALVYRVLAEKSGAVVERTVIFAESGGSEMVESAEALGLEVVVSGA